MKPSREPRQRLGEKRCRGRNRKGPSHPAVGENAGAEVSGDRNPKKRRGGVSCGAVHSLAREMVSEGYTATLVAATLAISRSSPYYRKKPRGSRADRTYDEQIVVAYGEKPAYGYRRVAWWLRRKENLPVNRKRVLRVMRERGLLVRSRRLRACHSRTFRISVPDSHLERESGGGLQIHVTQVTSHRIRVWYLRTRGDV